MNIHHFTHTGKRVLILKCVNSNMTSHAGFLWPSSGPVKPKYCSITPDCDSGGLFGWPWGFGLGDGKEPDYRRGKWIVFSAPPEQVISIDHKVKVAASTPEKVDAIVEFVSDDFWEAMKFLEEGRSAWIEKNAKDNACSEACGISNSTEYRGASSATGLHGASSATGSGGASSATGERGASSATGYYGVSSATGLHGASSATGDGGISGATGVCGVSSATGNCGASSATGDRGASNSTGDGGISGATGFCGASSATGPCGASSATGNRGASVATGDYGISGATGDRGISGTTGNGGVSKATGEGSVAVLTGEYGTLDVSEGATGISTAKEWYWRVRKNAVVMCRWNDGKRWVSKVLFQSKLKLKPGKIVKIVKGRIKS